MGIFFLCLTKLVDKLIDSVQLDGLWRVTLSLVADRCGGELVWFGFSFIVSFVKTW